VRQRHDGAAAVGQRRVEVLVAFNVFGEPLAERVVIHRRQPERLPPVAGIGLQRRAHQAAGDLLRRYADDAREVFAQLVRSPVAGRITRCGVERVARGEFRHRTHRQPPGRIAPVGHSATQRKPVGSGQFQARWNDHDSLFPGFPG
jgi:hypothetical protein